MKVYKYLVKEDSKNYYQEIYSEMYYPIGDRIAIDTFRNFKVIEHLGEGKIEEENRGGKNEKRDRR